MGIASLVVSIIAIILSLIPLVGLPVAIIALILAIVAMCRKKNKEVYRGLKIAGLVISIIAMAISTLITAPVAIGAYIASKNSQEIIDKAEEVLDKYDIQQVQNIAALAWSEAYLDERIETEEEYKEYVENRLIEKGIDLSNYELEVTMHGVTIKEKTGTDKTENNEQEDEGFDPYSNYKNIVWADKNSTDTEISNNKIYFLDKEVKANINGTLRNVETIIVGGFPTIYITTEENEAWSIGLDDIVNNTVGGKKQLLTKEKIVDMVALKTYASQYSDTTVYFLTETGKLIDENGVSYNKYSFVDAYKDVSRDIYISFDKDLNGYYYNAKNNTYTAIVSKSTGAKLAFSKIYTVGEKLLVVTAYNKLFEYDGKSNKATQITGDVSSVKKIIDGSNVDLLIIFKDGTTKVVDNVTYAYDVKNKKEIKIDSIVTFDPYANYKKYTWNTSTKIDSPVGIIHEIKNGKLYCTTSYAGAKTTQVTGMTGTPIKLKWVVIGGASAVYVLTDKGIIYLVSEEEIVEKTADLSKFNVIDMTIIDNHGQEYNYYLTVDGKLIDKNGVDYSENRFTDSYVLNITTKISIGKNLSGFYYDGKTYSEIQDNTTGKGIDISQIYAVDNHDLAIILSLDNKAYEYDGRSNKSVSVGEVETIEWSIDANDQLILIVRLKNGTYKGYSYCDVMAYDAMTKKEFKVTDFKRAEAAG